MMQEEERDESIHLEHLRRDQGYLVSRGCSSQRPTDTPRTTPPQAHRSAAPGVLLSEEGPSRKISSLHTHMDTRTHRRTHTHSFGHRPPPRGCPFPALPPRVAEHGREGESWILPGGAGIKCAGGGGWAEKGREGSDESPRKSGASRGAEKGRRRARERMLSS